MKLLVSLLTTALCLVSCAGYHLGGIKPASLAKVKNIAVPMFTNGTLHPRAEVLATSAVADALVQDGTYRITKVDNADAILEGTVRSIKYNAIRGVRLDTLKPAELSNTLTIAWSLRDAKNPTKILAKGTSSGTSQFFVSSNLQTARNNALPEACENAAESLISTISNGY